MGRSMLGCFKRSNESGGLVAEGRSSRRALAGCLGSERRGAARGLKTGNDAGAGRDLLCEKRVWVVPNKKRENGKTVRAGGQRAVKRASFQIARRGVARSACALGSRCPGSMVRRK